MNIFQKLLPNYRRKINSQQRIKGVLEETKGGNFSLSDDEDFSIFYTNSYISDNYLLHAWVNIAVNILIRNIARADFCIKKGGEDIEQGTRFHFAPITLAAFSQRVIGLFDDGARSFAIGAVFGFSL